MLTRAHFLLLALVVGGCGSPVALSSDAGSGGGDAAPIDAAIPAAPPSCALVQAPLAQAADAHAVLVTPRATLIGDDRGLWRSSGIGERFERVTTLPDGTRSMWSLLSTDDGDVVGITEHGIVISHDEGAHWAALGDLPGGAAGSFALRLYTDGTRVVVSVEDGGAAVASLYDLDRDTGALVEIVADAPVEGWGHSGFHMVGLDRGALLATPVGYRMGGLFRLEPAATRWVHVASLDGFGYTSFARLGEVAVVASPSGLWAEIDGTFQPVLEQELGQTLLVVDGAGLLGLSPGGVLRSPDGRTWELEAYADGVSRLPMRLSENAGLVAALTGGDGGWGAGQVSLSDDRGARWRSPMIVSQTFSMVAVHGAGDTRITYASPYAGSWYSGPAAWRGGAWSTFAWPLMYGASAVAWTETGAWACAFDGCVHRNDEGGVGPTIPMPSGSLSYEPTTAFATSHGLFVSPRRYGTSCGVVQPGLVVLRDPAAATWEDASVGLRSWPPECAGAPSVGTVSALLEDEGVLWATQSEQEPFAPDLFRSTDGGRHWSMARAGAALIALVRVPSGAFGLFRTSSSTGSPGGSVERLDASGETFSPVAAPPGGAVTDLVALDGQLVVATGSSLWRSADGATSWEPLVDEPRIGPITDLAVADSVLTIASGTSGIWEASRCFE